MILVTVLAAILVFFCISGVRTYNDRKLVRKKLVVCVLGIIDIVRSCIETQAENSDVLFFLTVLGLSIQVIRLGLVISIYKRSNRLRKTPVQGDGVIIYSPHYDKFLPIDVGRVLYSIGVPEEYFNTVEPIRLDRVEGYNTDQTVHVVFKPGDMEYPNLGEALGVKLFLTREAAEDRVKFFHHADCFSTVMERHGYKIEDPSRITFDKGE